MTHNAPPPIADAAGWAMFLDIDGTLLDLAPTPGEVRVPDFLPSLLDDLGRRFGGALALVSGRGLDGIDRLFPGKPDAVGCHGAEWRQGDTLFTPRADWVDEVAARIAVGADRLPGIRVERKALSLALHYRGVPELEGEVRTLAAAVLGAGLPPLSLMEGKSVVEIIPAGTTKGTAIEHFMGRNPYAGRRPVFAGDDVTDESGFVAVNGMGGLSIHVGDGTATRAHFRIPGPEAMRRWLLELNITLAGERPS